MVAFQDIDRLFDGRSRALNLNQRVVAGQVLRCENMGIVNLYAVPHMDAWTCGAPRVKRIVAVLGDDNAD